MTHRMSIDLGENEFLSEDAQGNIFLDAKPLEYEKLPAFLREAIAEHRKLGKHSLCVICQTIHEAPTQVDPRTPAQIALDQWQDETEATRASDRP